MALVDNFPFHFQLSYWPVQPSFSGFRCMRLTKRPTSNTEWWCHSIRAVPAAPSPSFFAHVPHRAVIIVIQYLCSRGVLLFEPLSFLLLSLFYAGFLLSFCALAPSFYPSLLLCCSDFETAAFLGLGFWTVHLQTGSSSDSEK